MVSQIFLSILFIFSVNFFFCYIFGWSIVGVVASMAFAATGLYTGIRLV